MNHVIVWGSIIIPIELLLLAVSAVAGYYALGYRLKSMLKPIDSKLVLDELFNHTVIGLLIWKLSPILFEFSFVLQNPLTLLYFTGGTKGLFLTVLYLIAVFTYRTKKRGYPILFYPDAIVTIMLAGGSMYAVLQLLFEDGGVKMALFALVTIVIYYLQVRDRSSLGDVKTIKEVIVKRGNLLTAMIIVGMLGWGIYDYVSSNNKSSDSEGIEAVRAQEGVRIGAEAADFSLTTLEGKEVQLSEYRGKRILLNFWATWCPPCKAEMPHMEKFHQEVQQEDIVVLAVNLTSTEKSAGKVASFAADHQLSFPIVLDQTGKVRDLYEVRAYPTSFVIDSNGIITDIYQGAISYHVMKRAFD